MARNRSTGAHIEGLRETVRSLQRFGIEAADLKSAFSKIGSLVSREAVSLTPVLSGKLAGSIRASKTKNRSEVRAGGARVPYAGVIHYGGYHGITAQPFLTEAVERKQGEAVDLMENELQSLIRQLGLN